jgi:hypothetical protein
MTENLRFYPDELQALATLLSEMPTAVTLPGRDNSWVRYPDEGLLIEDAGFPVPARLHFDYEAETWFVEFSDE